MYSVNTMLARTNLSGEVFLDSPE